MSLLAIIPARGGSKRILRKNIKMLAGKPLISWTIDVAKKVKCIDEIFVSTDNLEIANISESHGIVVPFLRPAKLSKDNSKSIDLVLHALENFRRYDWVLLLQPTSPLRSSLDIENIYKLCIESNASSAVSICEISKNSEWLYKINNDQKLLPFQNYNEDIFSKKISSNIFTLNGALYLTKTEFLKKHKSFINEDTLGYVMPKENSVDIDTLDDWKLAEYYLK